jgi:formyl-CoA transferase
MVAIQNEIEWKQFCAQFFPAVSDDARFGSNTLRVANRGALDGLIGARFRELDTPSATAMLDAAGIANAGVNTVSEFLEHPVLRSRGRWQHVGTPVGEIEMLVPPIDLSGETARMDPVPALGEHTAQVLRELGRSQADIEALIDRRIV